MNIIQRFVSFCLAALSLVTVTSCGQQSEEEKNFKILFASQKEFLIPTTTASCVARYNAAITSPPVAPSADITSKYFTIRQPQLYWYDKTRSMMIATITVTVTSDKLATNPYVCTVAGDELSAMFSTFSAGTHSAWSGTLTPGSSVNTSASICDGIVCGGIALATGVTSFAATATVEVQGIMTDTDGSQQPVKVQNTLTIQN